MLVAAAGHPTNSMLEQWEGEGCAKIVVKLDDEKTMYVCVFWLVEGKKEFANLLVLIRSSTLTC